MNPIANSVPPSKASIFVSTLKAQGFIKPEPSRLDDPVHEHRLSASVLFTMFYNILHPLVLSAHPIEPNLTNVDVITRSIAFDALMDTYAILYVRGTPVSSALSDTMGGPRAIQSYRFPVFVTSLISSIGPVYFVGLTHRGRHVPFLVLAEVYAQIPQSYRSFHRTLFNEKMFQLGMYALLDIQPMVKTSAWWTFHTYSENVGGDIKYTLWSPLRYDICDPVLRLGTLFAKSRLTRSAGIVNFTCTPFYDVNEPPGPDDFPSEINSYPYFNVLHPTYYRHLERSPARDETHHSQAPSTGLYDLEDLLPGAADAPGDPTVGDTTLTGIRERELLDGSGVKAGDDVVRYRFVYYYFDHQVTSNISDMQLYAWSTHLNAL